MNICLQNTSFIFHPTHTHFTSTTTRNCATSHSHNLNTYIVPASTFSTRVPPPLSTALLHVSHPPSSTSPVRMRIPGKGLEEAAVQELARLPFPNSSRWKGWGKLGTRGACIWTHVNWKCSCCSWCHVGGGVCWRGIKIRSPIGGLLHEMLRDARRNHSPMQSSVSRKGVVLLSRPSTLPPFEAEYFLGLHNLLLQS